MFWTKNKAGAEKKIPVIPLVHLSNFCSQNLRVIPYSSFAFLPHHSSDSKIIVWIELAQKNFKTLYPYDLHLNVKTYFSKW